MESSPASSSHSMPVTDSAADFAKDLQNQSLGAVGEGDKIKRKLLKVYPNIPFSNSKSRNGSDNAS